MKCGWRRATQKWHVSIWRRVTVGREAGSPLRDAPLSADEGSLPGSIRRSTGLRRKEVALLHGIDLGGVQAIWPADATWWRMFDTRHTDSKIQKY